MTRIGYDSTSPQDCPPDGDVYLGYNDGTYSGNYTEQKVRHPNKPVWSIGRFPDSHADWYDCENGLLTPVQAAQLAKGNLDRKEFAGIYCNASTWPKVRAELVARHILDNVKIWVAWEQPQGDSEIPDYAVGRQYLLSPGQAPGHYDKSVFHDYIEGLDAKPAPKPAHGTPFAADMHKAVHLATHRYDDRVKNKHPMDARAKADTHALIKAAQNALGVKG